MPDLFQSDSRTQAPAQQTQPEHAPDLRPGAADGLSADAVQGLADARQGGLQRLYGTDWEAAGEQLDEAFRTDGPSAYARLEREPETFGAVSGDRRYSEMVAGGLYARERVLPEARGEALPDTYRVANVAQSEGRTHQPTERLDVGESATFHYTNVRHVAGGGRTRGYGGASVAGGMPDVPIGISVGGFVSVDRLGSLRGVPSASVRIAAYAQTSTNAAGHVDNVLTSGRLVDVTPGGGGRNIPFSLHPNATKPVQPDSLGGTRDLGTGSVIVPTGRTYRVEFDVATNTPSRSPYRLPPVTYNGATFTATGR